MIQRAHADRAGVAWPSVGATRQSPTGGYFGCWKACLPWNISPCHLARFCNSHHESYPLIKGIVSPEGPGHSAGTHRQRHTFNPWSSINLESGCREQLLVTQHYPAKSSFLTASSHKWKKWVPQSSGSGTWWLPWERPNRCSDGISTPSSQGIERLGFGYLEECGNTNGIKEVHISWWMMDPTWNQEMLGLHT